MRVTEQAVEAAAGNLTCGKEVTQLLLEQRGNEVRVTEQVANAAVGKLLDRRRLGQLFL